MTTQEVSGGASGADASGPEEPIGGALVKTDDVETESPNNTKVEAETKDASNEKRSREQGSTEPAKESEKRQRVSGESNSIKHQQTPTSESKSDVQQKSDVNKAKKDSATTPNHTPTGSSVSNKNQQQAEQSPQYRQPPHMGYAYPQSGFGPMQAYSPAGYMPFQGMQPFPPPPPPGAYPMYPMFHPYGPQPMPGYGYPFEAGTKTSAGNKGTESNTSSPEKSKVTGGKVSKKADSNANGQITQQFPTGYPPYQQHPMYAPGMMYGQIPIPTMMPPFQTSYKPYPSAQGPMGVAGVYGMVGTTGTSQSQQQQRGSSGKGIRLALACDYEQLSDYQILVRQQLEIFQAGAEDVESNTQGRKKPVILGQVGLRCKHCAILPLRARGRGAVYYPAMLQGVYQAAQNMAGSHLCQSCQHIPISVKDELLKLKERRDNASGGKQYWADGCRALGIIETEDGLAMGSGHIEM